MKVRVLILLAVTSFGLLSLPQMATPGAGSAKDILVIGHSAVPVSSLSKGDLRNFFLKKQGRWPGGVKVVPVNAKDSSALRQDFRAQVLQMSAAEETRYWQDMKIKKGLTPPSEFGNVQKAVFNLKGSVSYVYRVEHKPGVTKVLLEIPAV